MSPSTTIRPNGITDEQDRHQDGRSRPNHASIVRACTRCILFNDDYTPRDFVVEVLKAVFRLNETQALNVMMTAHRKGVCVVAVFAQDIAETKAARGTEAGAAKGYPLRFGTDRGVAPSVRAFWNWKGLRYVQRRCYSRP